MRRTRRIGYSVTVGNRTRHPMATSAGNAIRLVVRGLFRTNRIRRQPRTDRDEASSFRDVFVDIAGEHIGKLGQPTRFIDLTNTARVRAGLPEKKERSRVRK